MKNGKPMNRIDGRAKVTGEARYAADWPEARLAHAVIFQSSIACGKITGFDLEDARAVHGVIEIITHENAPRLKKPSLTVSSGFGESFLPLQDPQVFYNGQFIGVVIAETLEAAQEAAARVKVRYEAGEPALGFEGRLDESYPKRISNAMQKINVKRGRPAQALKKAPVKIEFDYRTPMQNHNPIEPSATLAVWDADVLRVYDATQGNASMASGFAETLDLEADEVRVITKFVGGGFGCKGSGWPHQFIAAMSAMKTRRAVKLSLTRGQMFTGVGHRAATLQKVTLGADRDGTLLAIDHRVWNPTAMNTDFPEPCGNATPMLYACDNVYVEHRVVRANHQAPTFMRAPGEATGSFAVECAMDELAHALEMCPIALRLKNYAETDPHRRRHFSSKSLRQCYERGAERFGWDRRQARPGAIREGDEYVGFGMATANYPAITFSAQATVELTAYGQAKVRSATQDIGTGTYTVMTQVAAECLGLEERHVDFDLGDSRFPPASVSGGSSTASSVGSAIKRACDEVKHRLAKLVIRDAASPLHGEKEDALAFTDGRVHSAVEPWRGEEYGDVLRRHGLDSITGEGKIGSQMLQEELVRSAYGFGAQFAEVRVHALTGETRVTRMVGAFACGRILNPTTARSQFMGGMIFGIGSALMEHTFVDPVSGRVVTKDLADYHVPVNMDVPELDIVIVDEEDHEVNPLGTKGIGEIGIVGAAAAVVNAVYNATGVRVRDLPATPDRVFPELAVRIAERARRAA